MQILTALPAIVFLLLVVWYFKKLDRQRKERMKRVFTETLRDLEAAACEFSFLKQVGSGESRLMDIDDIPVHLVDSVDFTKLKAGTIVQVFTCGNTVFLEVLLSGRIAGYLLEDYILAGQKICHAGYLGKLSPRFPTVAVDGIVLMMGFQGRNKFYCGLIQRILVCDPVDFGA